MKVRQNYRHIDWGRLKTLRQRSINPKTGKPWTQTEIAKAIGASQSYIARIERGDMTSPDHNYIERMSTVFKMQPSSMLQQLEKKLNDLPVSKHPPQVTIEYTAPHIKKYAQSYNPKGFSHGTGVLLNNEDTVEGPPYLRNVKDAYSIVMPDDSMIPRYRRGDTLFVNPEVYAMSGDDVVIQLKLGERLMCIVGEVHTVDKVADPDAEHELTSYAIISCSRKQNLYCEQRLKAATDADYKLGDLQDSWNKITKHCDWYTIYDSDDLDKVMMDTNTGKPILRKDGYPLTEREFKEKSGGIGISRSFMAVDIHVIVGTHRQRFNPERMDATAHIVAKSIMTAKAEVGKLEIKTTDG